LVALVRHVVAHGFADAALLAYFTVAPDADAALEVLD
jgi:hypothetical protein